jgi:hypothetical protein
MRSLSDKYRLQALSLPEITDEIEELTRRIVKRGVEFQERKLRPGPLLNAIVLHFLGFPAEEQERIAVESLARLEALLSDAPAAEAHVADPTRTVLGTVEDPPAPARRRRKQS